MSYIVVNRPVVTLEIEDIFNYYKTISTKIAFDFLDRLEEARKYITNFPNGFQIKYKNVRTIMLKQFPYHVHYIVDDINKIIIVLAVIHAYKNPKN